MPRAIKPDLRLDSRRLKDHPREVGIEIGPALSPIDRLRRTWRALLDIRTVNSSILERNSLRSGEVFVRIKPHCRMFWHLFDVLNPYALGQSA
jgi:hypothetical protein